MALKKNEEAVYVLLSPSHFVKFKNKKQGIEMCMDHFLCVLF